MPIKNIAGATFVLAICASAALSNPLEFAERELSDIVKEPKILESMVNSKTMKAARSMCLMTADLALKQNPNSEKSFSEVVAHCAMGNLHHALKLMGNSEAAFEKHISAKVPSGIDRHFTKWEHTAIKTWDKIN